MGLTKLEIKFFIFLKKFHFYLFQFPIQWDDKYQQVEIVKSIFDCWLPFLFLFLCTFFYANCAGLTVINLYVHKGATKIEIILQLLICWSLNTVVFGATVIMTNMKIIHNAYNKVLQLDKQINKEFYHKQSKKYTGETQSSNILKFSVGPTFSVLVLVVPFAYVCTGLDTFNYILEYCLDDRMHRENRSIIGGFMARLLLLQLALLECFRFCAYIYTFVIVLLDRWNKLVSVPVITCRNAYKLLKTHLEYRMVLKILETFFQCLITPLLTLAFWGIVILLWVCVKCSAKQIGYLLYYWLFMALCLGSVVVSVLIPLLCNLLELDSLAVKYNIFLAKKELAQNRKWESKITLFRSIAVRRIELKYGYFGRLDKKFFPNLVQVLLLRCFDAIILFDY